MIQVESSLFIFAKKRDFFIEFRSILKFFRHILPFFLDFQNLILSYLNNHSLS